MSLVSEPLPTDLDALRLFAENLRAELAGKDREIAANAAEIYAKTLHIEKLKMQLAVLHRARFGRSSEKLDHDIEQLELLIGELEEDGGEGEARAGAMRCRSLDRPRACDRKHPVRKPLTRTICRARPSPTIRLAPAPAAAARSSAGSARMSAKCWNTCRPASR